MQALISGVTGQDGFYLSRLLLSKGYQVHGIVRYCTQEHAVPEGVEIHRGDVCDPGRIDEIVKAVRPHEIYHLAAMSHVGESFAVPIATLQINTIGTVNMLEASKRMRCKFYNAATSELFGNASKPPQNEKSPFAPCSPYAISKLASYWLAVNYREAHGLFACNGILFNHESPLRGERFVTQKICRAVAAISKGKQQVLSLGNLLAQRDWGHAEDYVQGMWLMMQQNKSEDYVLATGEMHSVSDFCHEAFAYVGLKWLRYVKSDTSQCRPVDINQLTGDASRARAIGWKPKHSFKDLVKEMVESALRSA